MDKDVFADYIYSEVLKILSANNKETEYLDLKKNKNDYSITVVGNIIMKIKLGKNNYLFIKEIYKNFIPDNFTIENTKSFPGLLRFEINEKTNFSSLSEAILTSYKKTILASVKEPFGCCSRYLQCSDELKCINPDKIFALGCSYKTNLESGRVFYGKNKNI